MTDPQLPPPSGAVPSESQVPPETSVPPVPAGPELGGALCHYPLVNGVPRNREVAA